MYQLFTHAAKGVEAFIQLDQIHNLRLPTSIMVGIGDKKKKYMNYLEKNFLDGENLYHVICEMHAIAIKKGKLALLSHPKKTLFHSAVLVEFMKNHLETLNLITPYVFPQDKEALDKIKAHVPTSEVPEDVKNSIEKLVAPAADQPAAQLSDDDKNQIWALMQADQLKNGVTDAVRPEGLSTAESQENVNASAEDPQQAPAESNEVAPEVPPEPVPVGYAPDIKEWTSNAKYLVKPLNDCLGDTGIAVSFAPQATPTEGNEVKTFAPQTPLPEGNEAKY